jgi:NAD(P)-dependent dehydrogenase (short-subunit alcohol dehydrogenase family)
MARSYLEELFSLNGRLALVTGASGGIGSELAFALAMAGARVALAGRSAERLERARDRIEAAGGSATVFAADMERTDAIAPLVRTIGEDLGPIDILVNCAGINRRQPIEDVVQETFTQLIDVNLRAPYFLGQAVLPGMIERGGGKIINIGSITTGWGVGNLSVYGLTKSAIGQLTRVMAVEWAAHNVQVNCLCPGWIKTELTKPVWGDSDKLRWITERVPTGRFGLPDDLVGLAVYLASPAGRYTTGQVIYVDGGFMAGGMW